MTYTETATILFAIINAAKLISYWQLQQFSNFDTKLIMWLAPTAIIGTVAGKHLTRILPDGIFFRAIQVTLFVLSCKLIGDFAAAW